MKRILCLAVLLAAAPACLSPGVVVGKKDAADPQGGSGGGNGGSGGGSSGGAGGGGGSPCAPGSEDMAGCPCDKDGERRACGSDVGACRKGEQICRAGSGTVVGGAWGPCEGGAKPGEEKCGDGVDNDCNGKADCADPRCDEFCKGRDGGSDPPPPSCACPPGISRWCHQGGKACAWGKQKCAADGSWGPCEVAGGAPPGCDKWPIYNHCCCAASGECCEDDSDHYNPKKKSGYKDGSGPSVGACTTAACGPPPPPPVPMCPGMGYCVPGAERYITPTFGSGGPWMKEVCSGDGSWGAPVSSSGPAGCSSGGDSLCCMAAGACCNFTNYGCWYGKCDGMCWKM